MTEYRPRASRVRRVLRWVPLVVIAGVQVVAWLAMLRGGMGGVVGWLALLVLGPGLGSIGLVVTGIYVIRKRRRSVPVLATLSASLLGLWPGAWQLGIGQIRYPTRLADAAPAARVRLPSDLPLRVAWGGDELRTNYHAFYPDQRWAYDLVVDPYFVGSDRLEAYGCWGTPVLAVAPARIAAVHDGEPDVAPGVPSNTTAPFGNFVAMELESKTFVVIAHLQKGSISVGEGDAVAEGQLLGRCGNSGNTSEPHIHIHHQRQDPKGRPPQFAEGLPLYFKDHQGPEMPRGGLRVEGERLIATGDLVRHVASLP